MTDNIIVRSNDPIVDAKPVVGSEPESAPAPKELEQKDTSTASEPVENEQEEDGELSADSNEEAEDSDKTRAKKKGGFKRRIEKLNARIAEQQKEAEYWRSQALKTSEAKPTEEPKPQARQSASDKPDPEQFDSHAEYVEALTDWKVSKFHAEKAAAEAKAQMQTEQQKALKAHVDRFQAYAEKNPDIHDLIEDVEDVPMSSTVQEIIVSSESGPALMHELAKNKARYAEICKMSPIAAARALGAIEAKLSAPSSEQASPKKLTSAPKPLSSVSTGKGVVTKSLDDPNLSQKEYERLRYEQIRNRA